MNYRTTATSMEASGMYAGFGIASFVILLITNFGWRNVYAGLGGLSLVVSLFALIGVKSTKKNDISQGLKALTKTQQEILPEEKGISISK